MLVASCFPDHFHNLFASGTDRIAIGVPVGNPLLPTERHDRDAFNVAPDDVFLAYVVSKAVMISVAFVKTDVGPLIGSGGGFRRHGSEPTAMEPAPSRLGLAFGP